MSKIWNTPPHPNRPTQKYSHKLYFLNFTCGKYVHQTFFVTKPFIKTNHCQQCLSLFLAVNQYFVILYLSKTNNVTLFCQNFSQTSVTHQPKFTKAQKVNIQLASLQVYGQLCFCLDLTANLPESFFQIIDMRYIIQDPFSQYCIQV